MNWAANMISTFDAARRCWGQQNPGQSDPRFWEIDFSPDEGDLAQAQHAVAQAIEQHRSCPPLAAILVLLYLLRTRLSNVSQSRLWPEVARELSGADLAVDPLRCGNFFRTMLNRADEAHLPWVHNRYVAWCLDQTDVGSNRADVVRAFLSFLLDQVRRNDSSVPAGLAAHALVKRFIAKQPNRDEIEVYQLYLQRTGRTIIELVRDLHAGDVFHELGFWNWTQLCDWWQARTGEDLNRLTPETRKVLDSLLSDWGDHVTRSSLSRFLAHTNVAFDVPRLKGSGPCTDPLLAPLGPVRLGTGNNSRHLQLCDDLGLTSDRICQHRPDCWHSIGNGGAFAWSKDSFVVQYNDGTRETSLPLFVGRSVSDARFAGTYCSSRALRGALPDVIGTTFDSRISPHLRLRYAWQLTRDGLQFRLFGFSIDFLLNHCHARLLIDDQIKWSGLLSESPLVELKPPAVLNALYDGDPEITIIDSQNHVLCRASVSRPGNGDAFLALNGQIQKHQTIGIRQSAEGADAPFPSGIIVGVSGDQLPFATGGNIVAIQDRIPVPQGRLYRVVPDRNADQIQIAVGPHRWELVRAEPVELLDAEKTVTLEKDIAVFATERINLVSADSPVLIRLPAVWLANDATGHVAFCLTVRTPKNRLRWTAPEVLHAMQSDAPVVFSLKELAATTGVALPSGLLRISIERPQVGGSETVCVFRCPRSIERVPGLIDETSSIRVNFEEQSQCVRSHHQVSLVDLQQCQSVEGWLDCGLDGAVRFCWLPRVSDLLLLSVDGRQLPDRPMNIADLANGLRFAAFGEKCEAWLITAGSDEWKLQAGQYLDVGRFVAEAVTNGAQVHNELIVCSSRIDDAPANSSESPRRWRLDLTPMDLRLNAVWSGGAESWHLHLALGWIGIASVRLDAEVKNLRGVRLASLFVQPAKHEASAGDGSLQQEWAHLAEIEPSVAALLNASEPGILSVSCRGIVMQQFALPPIPDDIAACRPQIDLKRSVRTIVEQMGASPAADDECLTRLTALCELHLRETGQLPITNLDALIVRIANRGTENCRREAIACLRLMRTLTSAPDEVVFDVPFELPGPLQLLLASLAAIHQCHLHGVGQADPSQIQKLVEVFEVIAAQDGDERDRRWAQLMTAFCRDLAQPSAEHGTDIVETTQDELLVGFDAHLNSWLAKNRKGSIHVGT